MDPPRLRRFLQSALAKPLRRLPVKPLRQPQAHPRHSGSKTSSSFLLLGLLCLVTLGVGAAAFYLFVLKPRKDSGSSYSGKSSPSGGGGASPAAGVSPSEEPTAQFITTYMIGDDLYDDSFSIDAPSGEFLGSAGWASPKRWRRASPNG